ncbi:MAG: hypothetical protein AAFW70_20520, partial [Cyanobacteria bacterium J06635_10]
MLSQKIAQVALISLSTSAIVFSGTASAQSVNQEINGSAVGPETFVDANNFTVNPTGSLNQKINCEARNDVVNIDPRCDANNTAIYGSHTTPHKPHKPSHPHHPHPPIDHPHVPNLNQHVENGGSNTTVVAPSKANSNSNSSSNSHSNANANSKSKSTTTDTFWFQSESLTITNRRTTSRMILERKSLTTSSRCLRAKLNIAVLVSINFHPCRRGNIGSPSSYRLSIFLISSISSRTIADITNTCI